MEEELRQVKHQIVSPRVLRYRALIRTHLSSIMSANRSDNYLNAHMLNCGLLNSLIAIRNPAGISIWHPTFILGDKIPGPAIPPLPSYLPLCNAS